MAGLGMSFRISTSQTRAALRDIDRRVDRATMYTVRAAGRVAKQTAKREVRVYQGPRPDIPRGRLRQSIHSSKQLKREGAGAYSVTVGPRGWPARGYAGKIEALDGYMSKGRDEAMARIHEIAATSWAKASRGRRG